MRNPTPKLGRIQATNPCGEQPLLAYEACNLGSINVARFVHPVQRQLDWAALSDTIQLAVRFLDDVIDVNHYPVQAIREVTLGNRKIGLGVMGFADCLILLGIRYDSQEAMDFANQLSEFIQQHSHAASQQLAKERGSFPNWEDSVWATERQRPIRNAACTTIAPTGSISIIACCSSGIEPIYSLAGLRRGLDGGEFVQVHPLLEQIGQRDRWMNDRIRAALLEGAPALDILGIPKDLARTLVTAHEIAPAAHVAMQAAFQDNVDNAVSKTVNLPAAASTEDVDTVFQMAFDLRCKGITVYRDGSRAGQTLSKVSTIQQLNPASHTTPRIRTRVTHGKTTKFRMGCGTLFVTVNRDDQGLCEVFANLGKAGGCPAQSEATCRAISAALRSGVAPHELINQLRGIRCLSAATARKNGETNVLSCPDAIGRAIQETLGSSSEDPHVSAAHQVRGRVCWSCGHLLRREGGCFVCDRCYESSCS